MRYSEKKIEKGVSMMPTVVGSGKNSKFFCVVAKGNYFRLRFKVISLKFFIIQFILF